MAYGAKTGGKQKGYKAPHTLEAAIQRQKLIEMYAENAEEIHWALIEKAKDGDIQAIKEILDRAHGKPLQTNENVTVEKLSISDDQYKQLIETATSRIPDDSIGT